MVQGANVTAGSIKSSVKIHLGETSKHADGVVLADGRLAVASESGSRLECWRAQEANIQRVTKIVRSRLRRQAARWRVSGDALRG